MCNGKGAVSTFNLLEFILPDLIKDLGIQHQDKNRSQLNDVIKATFPLTNSSPVLAKLQNRREPFMQWSRIIKPLSSANCCWGALATNNGPMCDTLALHTTCIEYMNLVKGMLVFIVAC